MFSDNFNYRDMEKLHKEFMFKGAKVVEIDSMLLYDHNINATQGEITENIWIISLIVKLEE